MSAPTSSAPGWEGKARSGAEQCAYAACSLLAVEQADGWAFCRQHLREHRALIKGDDGVFREHVGWELKPCGTEAAWKRHRRRGEPACEACLLALRIATADRARRAARTPSATAGRQRRSSPASTAPPAA